MLLIYSNPLDLKFLSFSKLFCLKFLETFVEEDGPKQKRKQLNNKIKPY